MEKYVFDLDNTLVYTNSLNNESYNFALQCHGLMAINDCKRITRSIVFNKYPHLNDNQKSKIINTKQEYFYNNLQCTKANTALLRLLKSQTPESCILWTSADKNRVKTLLEYYKIHNAFKNILFSNKNNISEDIVKIGELLKCNLEQLVFYEDNQELIKKLQELKLNVISVFHSNIDYNIIT